MLANDRANTLRGSKTIFVGDLGVSIDEDNLRGLFGDHGAIVEIRMKKIDGRKNPGYCFIEFSSQKEAAKAMVELDGAFISGRALRVRWATDPHQDNSSRNQQEGDDGRDIQVMVSFKSKRAVKETQNSVTEQTIRDIFSSYGPIVDVVIKRINTNEDTNKQCGYGFIHFPYTYEGLSAAEHIITSFCKRKVGDVVFDCAPGESLQAIWAAQQQHQQQYHSQHSSPSSHGYSHAGAGYPLMWTSAYSPSQHQGQQYQQQLQQLWGGSSSDSLHSNMSSNNSFSRCSSLSSSTGTTPRINYHKHSNSISSSSLMRYQLGQLPPTLTPPQAPLYDSDPSPLLQSNGYSYGASPYMSDIVPVSPAFRMAVAAGAQAGAGAGPCVCEEVNMQTIVPGIVRDAPETGRPDTDSMTTMGVGSAAEVSKQTAAVATTTTSISTTTEEGDQSQIARAAAAGATGLTTSGGAPFTPTEHQAVQGPHHDNSIGATTMAQQGYPGLQKPGPITIPPAAFDMRGPPRGQSVTSPSSYAGSYVYPFNMFPHVATHGTHGSASSPPQQQGDVSHSVYSLHAAAAATAASNHASGVALPLVWNPYTTAATAASNHASGVALPLVWNPYTGAYGPAHSTMSPTFHCAPSPSQLLSPRHSDPLCAHYDYLYHQQHSQPHNQQGHRQRRHRRNRPQQRGQHQEQQQEQQQLQQQVCHNQEDKQDLRDQD